ncbi:MAG TPA: hypothetical protein VJU61_00500 [Polyangiaceae bacterium]|nr:hypothetical protein [Polyangiaceae bacterium]
MAVKPSGWMWILGAVASLLALLIVLLLRCGAESISPADGAGGMRPGLRKPFPEGGELDGVQRPGTLQPRKKLAPDPQFQRPERQ